MNKAEIIKRLAEIDTILSDKNSLARVVTEGDKIIFYSSGLSDDFKSEVEDILKDWSFKHEENKKTVLENEQYELEGFLFTLLCKEGRTS